ncbi:MAG: hypothetical protein WA104_07985 [Thermodesulfovibrionales bacterium]
MPFTLLAFSHLFYFYPFALRAAVQLKYANPEKKALSSPPVNGENVIMPINTKSPANVLKADANGVKRNENKKDN